MRGLSANQKIKKVAVKNADGSMNYIKKPDITYRGKTATIRIWVSALGAETISFKIDGIEYTTKVSYKKYTNPSKSVTVTNLARNGKVNLAIGWKKDIYFAGTALSKTTSNATMRIKAKKGWKVQSVRIYSMFGSLKFFSKKYSKPQSSVNVKVNKTFTKGDGYFLEIQYINSKNKGTITQTLMFI